MEFPAILHPICPSIPLIIFLVEGLCLSKVVKHRVLVSQPTSFPNVGNILRSNNHVFEAGPTPQVEPCLWATARLQVIFSLLDWDSLTSYSVLKFSIGILGKNMCTQCFQIVASPSRHQNIYQFLFASLKFLYIQEQSQAHTQKWKNNPREENSDNRLFTSELYPLRFFCLFKLLCLHSFPMSFKYIFPNLSAFILLLQQKWYFAMIYYILVRNRSLQIWVISWFYSLLEGILLSLQ